MLSNSCCPAKSLELDCKFSLCARSNGRESFMKAPNIYRVKQLVWARTAVLWLGVAAGSAVHAESEIVPSRGTVNIALANANGIVLLTDSAQSYKQSGVWHHTQPVQKLFRLDDRTVCSIAGFASETGWPHPQLDTEVSGIIADFKDQLARQPVAEVDAKLRGIGFLVGHYLDVITNRQEVVNPSSTAVGEYEFQVIVAGYDPDGQSRIEKLVLVPVVPNAAQGRKYWTHSTRLELPTEEHGLSYLLGGIPYVSRKILESPEEFPGSPAIRSYARSKKANGRDLLTVEQLAALASAMAKKTANHPLFTGFVGGDDQIAILTKGKIAKLDQPSFAAPPRPLKFALMVSPSVVGAQYLVTSPDVSFLWIRTRFTGFRNPRLRLDNQFFYKCEIRDSIVEYSGGLTDFGPTNTVVNSMLFPAYVNSLEEVNRILKAFPWIFQPPNTAPVQPTVEPN